MLARGTTPTSHGRLATDIGRARTDLEAMGAQVFDRASDAHLLKWANQRRHDVFLYRGAMCSRRAAPGSSRPRRCRRASRPTPTGPRSEEHREIVRREAILRGSAGLVRLRARPGRSGPDVARPSAFPFSTSRTGVDERFAVTGSVLLAGYLLTLVLVLVGGIYAARRLARPLASWRRERAAWRRDELDVELAGGGKDELGELVAPSTP